MSRLDPADMAARLVELTLLEAFEAGPPQLIRRALFTVRDNATLRTRTGHDLLAMLIGATGDRYIARAVLAEFTIKRVLSNSGPLRNFQSAKYAIRIYES